MGCNWELFELRVVVFMRGERNRQNGNFSGQILWEFHNVTIDLRSLGLADFKGSGEYCNFKTVFTELVKAQMIPFSFGGEKFRSDRLNFGNLQAAERNGRKFTAAKLYVHRRNQPSEASLESGEGVLLGTVSVDFTAIAKGSHYVQLSGEKASLVN